MKRTPRSRYRQLTRENRYQIRALLDADKSPTEISTILRCHRSTIYREIRRGAVQARRVSVGPSYYRPGWAHKVYLLRRSDRRAFASHVKIRGWLERRVREKLCLAWSPQQISERLKLEKRASVSHEAIYRYILWDKKLGGALYKCLRQYGHHRKRYGRVRRLRAPIAQRRPLTERPEIANKRAEIGHWERDLVIGKRGRKAILTIVDRKSRYTLIESVESRRPSEILRATIRALTKRGKKARTMTNDNGFEFADHLDLTAKLGLPVFFARPYASWERGTNENTNGLLRQFIPKGDSMDEITDRDFREIEAAINLRPRRVLGYRTPNEAHHGVKEIHFAQAS